MTTSYKSAIGASKQREQPAKRLRFAFTRKGGDDGIIQ